MKIVSFVPAFAAAPSTPLIVLHAVAGAEQVGSLLSGRVAST